MDARAIPGGWPDAGVLENLMSNERRYARAVHESGHAVMAWALCVPVERLWVDDDENGGGGTNAGCAPVLIDHIGQYRAGHQATMLLEIDAPKHWSTCDMKNVIELVGRLPSDEASNLIEAGGARARELLKPNLELLKAVADELEKLGAMDSARFLELAKRYGNRQQG
jgi:hypothetical protein